MARIVIEDVWKKFQLRHDRADSVGNLLLRMVPGRSRPTTEEFWALKGVTVDMPDGQSLGVIGDNGSGKSTLLKILTKTMLPTRGRVRTEGRLSALIELGAGFHPDFTGRENIVLNASIMGIRRREIEKKMDEIIDFADIRPFIDTPVKYYSSGMYARLGFSVATSVEPDILIVDEVLSVGDEAFQQKCMDRIFEMKRKGTSILLVSHGLDAIERLMDRAVWVHRGEMRAVGVPRDVVAAYRGHTLQRSAAAGDELTEGSGSDAAVALTECELHSRGARSGSFRAGEPAALTLGWENRTAKPQRACAEVIIRRPDGLAVIDISGLRDAAPFTLNPGGSRVRVDLEALHLATGRYDMDVQLRLEQGTIIGSWVGAGSFEVQAFERSAGVLAVPHRWELP